MSTRDIKDFLIRQIEQLDRLNDHERGISISDIIDSLSSSRVSVTQEVSDESLSPIPAYDASEDGDYSAWLVRNNID